MDALWAHKRLGVSPGRNRRVPFPRPGRAIPVLPRTRRRSWHLLLARRRILWSTCPAGWFSRIPDRTRPSLPGARSRLAGGAGSGPPALIFDHLSVRFGHFGMLPDYLDRPAGLFGSHLYPRVDRALLAQATVSMPAALVVDPGRTVRALDKLGPEFRSSLDECFVPRLLPERAAHFSPVGKGK